MPNVIVDPEELRQFSYHMNKLAMDLRSLSTTTRVKMNHLNQTWRDTENAHFVQRFEQDIKPLEKLIQTCDEYHNFLLRKASTLDPYFNTRK